MEHHVPFCTACTEAKKISDEARKAASKKNNKKRGKKEWEEESEEDDGIPVGIMKVG
jgi:NAD-dependent histone deacetylase SIR2